MEYRCVFPNCTSSGANKGPEHPSIFPFPKEPNLRCKWIGAVPGLKKRLNSASAICSLHFLLRDFNEKEELRPGSVPVDREPGSSLCSLSDLADQLESHPESIPSNVQHLTSEREYSFYKIRFHPKRPPVVSFSLSVYDDLSFDVSHSGSRPQGTKVLKLKSLGDRTTFRSIQELQDVLEELDGLPEPTSWQLRAEDILSTLSELSESSCSAAEIQKLEFFKDQIRLLGPSPMKKSTPNKKVMASFRALHSRMSPSSYKTLGNFLTLPDNDDLQDESTQETREYIQSFIEDAEFLTNDEFKKALTSRIAEKDSPVKEVVTKILNKLWSGNVDDFSSDICVTAYLLLNEMHSLYSMDSSSLEEGELTNEKDASFSKANEITVKEEILTEVVSGHASLEDAIDLDKDAQMEMELEHGEEDYDSDEEMEDEEYGEEDNIEETPYAEEDVILEEGFDDNSPFVTSGDNPLALKKSSELSLKFSFNCCFCTQKLINLAEFITHCSFVHKGNDVVLKITPGPVLTIKKNLTDLTCADCKTEHHTLEEMHRHVNHHANIIYRSTLAGKKKVQVFACGICDTECASKVILREHYGNVHPTYTIFDCKRCSQLFYKCSEYLKHKLYYHKKRPVNPDKLYKCDLCEKKFRFKHYLDKHYATDHQQWKYTCDICGKVFDMQRYLSKHRARSHPDSYDYICELCGKKFAVNEYLSSHKKICKYRRNVNSSSNGNGNKFKCDKCDRVFSSEVYRTNHKAVVHEKTKAYVCSICNKHMLSLVNLKVHMTTHEENRPKFPCNQCDKEYLNKATLTFHIATTHEKDKREKTFKCNDCDWSFWEAKNLKNHIKLVHDKVYDHKCDICGRSFGCRRHLVRHKTTIHDKFREYRCHICSVEYFQKPSLKNHLKKVHAITDYMPPKLPSPHEELNSM